MVFKRGHRKADLTTIRGHHADFEGKGTISRASTGCSCFGNKFTLQERTLLIKGPFCFVFDATDDSSLLYAVSLHRMKAKALDSTHVELSTTLGDVEYEIVLHDPEQVTRFVEAVERQSSIAQSEEVRRKLGHGNLIHKRASLRFAENVAKTKVKEQPEPPLKKDVIDDAMRVAGPMVY